MSTQGTHTQAEPQENPCAILYSKVRGAFIARGSSLAAWCAANNLNRIYVRACLLGLRNGVRARAIREKVIEAALGASPNA